MAPLISVKKMTAISIRMTPGNWWPCACIVSIFSSCFESWTEYNSMRPLFMSCAWCSLFFFFEWMGQWLNEGIILKIILVFYKFVDSPISSMGEVGIMTERLKECLIKYLLWWFVIAIKWKLYFRSLYSLQILLYFMSFSTAFMWIYYYFFHLIDWVTESQ